MVTRDLTISLIPGSYRKVQSGVAFGAPTGRRLI